jgi:hypothetical protein
MDKPASLPYSHDIPVDFSLLCCTCPILTLRLTWRQRSIERKQVIPAKLWDSADLSMSYRTLSQTDTIPRLDVLAPSAWSRSRASITQLSLSLSITSFKSYVRDHKFSKLSCIMKRPFTRSFQLATIVATFACATLRFRDSS